MKKYSINRNNTDGRLWGLSYLFAIGIPSIISAANASPISANLQIHTITRHMRCEQIGKRRDTSVDIMAYRGRPNIGMPIMRRIIQPIIKSSRRMKRKVAIFILYSVTRFVML